MNLKKRKQRSLLQKNIVKLLNLCPDYYLLVDKRSKHVRPLSDISSAEFE